MQALTLEQKIFELEGVRVIVRASGDEKVGKYDYQRCATGTMTLADWLKKRVYPLTGDLDVVVVNGRGEMPHGKTHMNTLRDSYAGD
ncbi:hypothetical protein [uncultured Sphingomonas sp.]|uniref:hypothetical protein n=1 Tax=uncultured Sphingomonas sp. TaxID=158754 RepID=UPI0035CA8581